MINEKVHSENVGRGKPKHGVLKAVFQVEIELAMFLVSFHLPENYRYIKVSWLLADMNWRNHYASIAMLIIKS